jgi:hypothetical protein
MPLIIKWLSIKCSYLLIMQQQEDDRQMGLIKQDKDTGVLTIKGPLTIQNAAAIKDMLLRAVKGVNRLIIKIEGVADADLLVIQLLFATRSYMDGINKTVEIIPGARMHLSGQCRGPGLSITSSAQHGRYQHSHGDTLCLRQL